MLLEANPSTIEGFTTYKGIPRFSEYVYDQAFIGNIISGASFLVIRSFRGYVGNLLPFNQGEGWGRGWFLGCALTSVGMFTTPNREALRNNLLLGSLAGTGLGYFLGNWRPTEPAGRFVRGFSAGVATTAFSFGLFENPNFRRWLSDVINPGSPSPVVGPTPKVSPLPVPTVEIKPRF